MMRRTFNIFFKVMLRDEEDNFTHIMKWVMLIVSILLAFGSYISFMGIFILYLVMSILKYCLMDDKDLKKFPKFPDWL